MHLKPWNEVWWSRSIWCSVLHGWCQRYLKLFNQIGSEVLSVDTDPCILSTSLKYLIRCADSNLKDHCIWYDLKTVGSSVSQKRFPPKSFLVWIGEACWSGKDDLNQDQTRFLSWVKTAFDQRCHRLQESSTLVPSLLRITRCQVIYRLMWSSRILNVRSFQALLPFSEESQICIEGSDVSVLQALAFLLKHQSIEPVV